MKKRIYILVFDLLFLVSLLHAAEAKNLRCEYQVNPIGVDATSPRLSWNILSQERGDYQRAYQILVASTSEKLAKDQGDIWNTGKINSDQSVQIEYKGKTLQSATSYFWKVKIWDMNGQPSKWSEPAYWSMGLLTREDWNSAQWIAYKDGEQWTKEWKQHKESELSNLPPVKWPNPAWPWKTGKDSTIFTLYEMANPKYDPSPLFRKEFSVDKKISSARLFICGLGYYEAFLNGEKVGDHVLDPAWTNFDQRSLYVTYDITQQLKKGTNAIGVMLGRGQYNPLCNDTWGLSVSSWVDQPKLIALLQIEYTDGTKSTVVTDRSWKTSGGPAVYDDTRHGELYDARLEQKGWSAPAFDETNWKNASVVQWNAQLESQMMPPVRCFAPLVPVKTFPRGEGETIYKLEKNISGWARVKVRGTAGAKVLVEYCETPSDKELVANLTPSRFKYSKEKHYASFYDKGINVRQQNGYILKGGDAETFECHFSYKGFQFIRVTADKGVTVEQVEGIPVHTDVELVGDFTCSNPLLNQIQKNSVNSLLNNYQSIATDCPHREKQGWTADNYLSATAAMYNFNMALFYTKWITDLAETQDPDGGLCAVAPSTRYDQGASTAWPAAIAFVPWNLYEFYADTRVMGKNQEVITRFAKSSLKRQVDGKPEIISDILGDWVSPLMELNDAVRNNTMAPPEGRTLYGTAAHYLVVKRLAEINRVLGKADEANEMNAWANRIAVNFNKEFFNANAGIYHGENPTSYRQSANVVPLEYGLVPSENQAVVTEHLEQDIRAKGDRLSTGFLGTPALMDYLSVADPELAYKLATQDKYPSWGYMIRQGATSMWEAWDGYDSRNHLQFCLISAYFYKHLAGIQYDIASPGFRHIIINPSVVGDLNSVNAYHDCPYGRILSNWTRQDGKLSLNVSIPVNTTATIYVPAKFGTEVLESGQVAKQVKGLKYLGEQNGKVSFEVGSGNYQFQSIL